MYRLLPGPKSKHPASLNQPTCQNVHICNSVQKLDTASDCENYFWQSDRWIAIFSSWWLATISGRSCFPCWTFYVYCWYWTLLDKISGKVWDLCRSSAEVCRPCLAYFAITGAAPLVKYNYQCVCSSCEGWVVQSECKLNHIAYIYISYQQQPRELELENFKAFNWVTCKNWHSMTTTNWNIIQTLEYLFLNQGSFWQSVGKAEMAFLGPICNVLGWFQPLRGPKKNIPERRKSAGWNPRDESSTQPIGGNKNLDKFTRAAFHQNRVTITCLLYIWLIYTTFRRIFCVIMRAGFQESQLLKCS